MKRYKFIKKNRKRFPVRRLCAMMCVSSSGYYTWRKRPVISQRAKENAVLIIEISDIHKKSRESHGSPKVHKELLARGHRVARLMRASNIVRIAGISKKNLQSIRKIIFDAPCAEDGAGF
jgi:putative transposase